MTREEWAEMLATTPATPLQVGAIHGEFRRLGFIAAERDERLAACAALLGLERLWSTRDLVMGDAGLLVRLLRELPDRAALIAAIAAAPASERPQTVAQHRLSLAAALAQALAALPPTGLPWLTTGKLAAGEEPPWRTR
jgi:hypothetical protein